MWWEFLICPPPARKVRHFPVEIPPGRLVQTNPRLFLDAQDNQLSGGQWLMFFAALLVRMTT